MKPHDNLTRRILPGLQQRVDTIIEREGGSRLPSTITITCCNGMFQTTGPIAETLAAAAAHRQDAHPETVKTRKHPPRAEVDAIGRANGTRISADKSRRTKR